MHDLKAIYVKWQNDPEFRKAFDRNPVDALDSAGFKLSEEDLQKVKAMLKLDKSQNEELDDRISK